MPHLRLFGPARAAAGTSGVMVAGHDVGEVIAAAEQRFGEAFSRVVATSKIWVNGEVAEQGTSVSDEDEVAVIPPVSGG